MFKLVTSCATIAVAAIAAPAHAGTSTVSYADLDLSSQDGIDALHSRVRKAAREVCGFNDAWKTRDFYMAHRCAYKAIQAAKPQVHTAVAQFRTDIRRADAGPLIQIES